MRSDLLIFQILVVVIGVFHQIIGGLFLPGCDVNNSNRNFTGCLLLKQAEVDDKWKRWKLKNGRDYGGDQATNFQRYSVYISNRQFVETQRTRRQKGDVEYDVDLNQFADMNVDEVNKWLFGFEPSNNNNGNLRPPADSHDDSWHNHRRRPHYWRMEDIPSSSRQFNAPANGNYKATVDWRFRNAVSPVRSQNSCGACWAFSTVGAIEGRLAIRTGKMIPLSVQNLIDCARDFHTNGCKGASMENAYPYVNAMRGINTYDAYPYTAKEGPCKFNNSASAKFGNLYTFVKINRDDESQLLQAVQTGPVAVAMNAKSRGFVFYSGGIYSEPNCDKNAVNHAVLLVGYGTSASGTPYWIGKNSWSDQWGEKGFFRVARGKNVCGLARYASFPVLL